MSLSKLNTNLNNVSSLPDKPTYTAEELKAIFDKSGNDIKKYINEVLTTEIEKLITEKTDASKITIEDNLKSDSSNSALSAKQGKILNENLDNKQKKISYGTEEPSGGTDGDIYIQIFE